MGVKGLWTLLSASGRCIPLETLTLRTLAIDVSLWLVQFVKAMRSDDGQVRQDAHLIGMFKRICRLLLFGIRPIFVYDGPPPMLKRKTLAARRRLRDTSELRWKRTAERILLTQLKLKTIRELRNQIEKTANGAVDPEELKEISESMESERVNQATKDEFAELFQIEDDESADDCDIVETDFPDRHEIAIPNDIDAMDPDSLAALPYSMQFEVLEKFREDRAHESRLRHIASARAPTTFSSTQLNQFLETSAFNRKISELRSKVGGDTAVPSSQAIATMPDTLFYFHKNPAAKLTGKRQRQELLRAAKSVEKPSFSFSDYHMESWPCSKCGLANLAIRRSCQRCGHGFGQEVATWYCSVCSATNPEHYSHCSSCQQTRQCAILSSVPDVLDRTAEIDALFDDVSDIASLVQESISEEEITQDATSSESRLQNPITETTDPTDLLTIRNSRLNFYRLQRKSSITYSQEEASRFAPSGEAARSEPTHESAQPLPSRSPSLTSGDTDILDVDSVENHKLATPTNAELSDNHDFASIKSDNGDTPLDIDQTTTFPLHEIHKTNLSHSPSLQSSKTQNYTQPTRSRQSASIMVTEPHQFTDIPAESCNLATSVQAVGNRMGLPYLPQSTASDSSSDREVRSESMRRKENSPSASLANSLPIQSHNVVSEFQAGPDATSQSVSKSVPIVSLALDIDESKIMDDLNEMRSAQMRNLRDADHITDEMVQETQQLLRLFGIPFVRAPAEAEAQCAALELMGLVDGVVTDDSDVFLFGARNVYRNMFSSDKTVERYQMSEIERELGVDREKLIRMALLLGSDYTDGIHGIGIVNAIEIVNCFDDFTEFREWVYCDDDAKGQDYDSGEQGQDGQLVRLRKFKFAHRNLRRNWQVSRDFPDEKVFQTYMEPLVDNSEEQFFWSRPDIPKLKQFFQEHLQWKVEMTEGLLNPVLRKLQDSTYQTRLEAFFGSGEKAANIRSKRIKQAVQDLTSTTKQ